MYSSRGSVLSSCTYFARELCDAAPGVSSTLRREDAKRLMMNMISSRERAVSRSRARTAAGSSSGVSSSLHRGARFLKNSLCVFVINIRHTTPSSRYVPRSLTSCRRSRRTCAGATCLVCNRRGDRTRRACRRTCPAGRTCLGTGPAGRIPGRGSCPARRRGCTCRGSCRRAPTAACARSPSSSPGACRPRCSGPPGAPRNSPAPC